MPLVTIDAERRETADGTLNARDGVIEGNASKAGPLEVSGDVEPPTFDFGVAVGLVVLEPAGWVHQRHGES